MIWLVAFVLIGGLVLGQAIEREARRRMTARVFEESFGEIGRALLNLRIVLQDGLTPTLNKAAAAVTEIGRALDQKDTK